MLRAGFLYVCGVYIKIWLYAASTFTIPSLCVYVRAVLLCPAIKLFLCVYQKHTNSRDYPQPEFCVCMCAERAPFFTAHVLSSFEDNSMPWLIT